MSLSVIGDNSSFEFIEALQNGNDGNMSTDNFTKVYNERPLSAAMHFLLIFLYSCTIVLAVIGNVLAIIIFTKGRRSKTELRPFLINLAVADLIMAVFCIPFTFTYQLLESNWIFSKPMCPIVLFLQIVSVTGSVTTNVAIGIDRFGAIVFPLRKSRLHTLRYPVTIVIIWIIAIACASVQLFVGKIQKNNYNNHTECNEVWPNDSDAFSYTIILLILTYLVPVVVLTLTYSIVGYLLWKRNLPGNADMQRDQVQLKSKLKIVKMLVTIVVLFALCWLPLHTFFLVLNFTEKADHSSLSIPYFFCHWIAMSNSFVNPIVYGLLNDSFRADLKSLVLCFMPNKGHSGAASRQGALKIKNKTNVKYTVNFSRKDRGNHNRLEQSYFTTKYTMAKDRRTHIASNDSSDAENMLTSQSE